MGFVTKTYEIHSNKVNSGNAISIVLLSDLHLAEYGCRNESLLYAIDRISPDLILSTGDLVTAKPDHSTEVVENLMRRLVHRYPVYYALGNHEERLRVRKDLYDDMFTRFYTCLTAMGVKVLCNEKESITIKGTELCIYGLELPLSYYKKMAGVQLETSVIHELLGCPDCDKLNVLLAHHPRFGDAYFEWGPDVILSGHVHGGVMRLGTQACISPDFSIFPKYGYGAFHKDGKHMIVSGGLGEHTIPFRIFNPKELVHLKIK